MSDSSERTRTSGNGLRALVERPGWLIGVCLTGWILALLIAAFSCGIYIGRYGLSREGLILERQFDHRPQGGAPQPGGGAMPGERPALVGRVNSISGERMELATREGIRPVTLAEGVEVLGPDREPMSIDELQEGMMVAVFGQMQQLGELVADRIEVLADQDRQQPPQ